MPLWDSVQRGLEKATQEASRIAKTQRLRSTIDGLTRQVNAQNSTIFNKTMDLFVAGQLTQSELLPLCQEMVNLQQQLNQAQNELKQLQAQASQAQTQGPQTQTGTSNPYLPPGSVPYPPVGEGFASTVYAPPPPEYQTYLDSTEAIDVPPPPPGMEPATISTIETMQMNMETKSASETRLCPVCQAELPPNNAFCHNCGAPVQATGASHLPTMRAGYVPTDIGMQETIRANTPGHPAGMQQFANNYPPTTRGEQAGYATPQSDMPTKLEPRREDSSPIDDAARQEAAQNEGA